MRHVFISQLLLPQRGSTRLDGLLCSIQCTSSPHRLNHCVVRRVFGKVTCCSLLDCTSSSTQRVAPTKVYFLWDLRTNGFKLQLATECASVDRHRLLRCFDSDVDAQVQVVPACCALVVPQLTNVRVDTMSACPNVSKVWTIASTVLASSCLVA